MFFERFCYELGLETLFHVRVLEAPVFVLQLVHPCHQRGVHAIELRAPLVERGVADAVLAAQLRYRAAGIGLLEDGDDLAIGKAGRRHIELPVS